MIRKVGAGIVGVAVAMALVWLVETIGHTVWPTPADLDTSDVDVMRAYVDTLPLGAMLTVALAWFVGALAGTFAACRLGAARPLVYIPHPFWFSALGLLGIFAGTWLGMNAGARKETAS